MKRQHARDWLTERSDSYERHEQWRAIQEIVVIVLIGWEIHDGRQQARLLQHLDTSAAATASAMTAASSSLQSLADAQAKSLDRLSQMSDTLRDSLKTSGAMASATHKQLNILEREQADRTAQLAKQPKFSLTSFSMAHSFDPKDPLVWYSFEKYANSTSIPLTLLNFGDLTAHNGVLHVYVHAKDVDLLSEGTFHAELVEQTRDEREYVMPLFQYIRPLERLSVSLRFGYKLEQTPFFVDLTVHADEASGGVWFVKVIPAGQVK